MEIEKKIDEIIKAVKGTNEILNKIEGHRLEKINAITHAQELIFWLSMLGAPLDEENNN